MTAATDADLIHQALSGRREAFGALVQRYEAVVCAVAYSRLGRADASEDVAQETFLIAWRKLEDVARTPAKLAPWLCGIARNVARGRWRKDAREVPEGALDERAADEERPHVSVVDEMIVRESEALVWRALAEVPPRYREPLVLHYRGGRSVREVAHALEISETAVKQRLSRGRKLLRSEVESITTRVLEEAKPSRRVFAGVMAALPVTPATLAGPGPASATPTAAMSPATKWGAVAAVTAGVGLAIVVGVSHRAVPSTPRAAAAAAVSTADVASSTAVDVASSAVPVPVPAAAPVVPDHRFVRWISRFEAARVASLRADGLDVEDADEREPPTPGRSTPIDLEVRDAPVSDLMRLFGDVLAEPIFVDDALAEDTVTLQGAGRPAIDLLDDVLQQIGAQRRDIDTLVLLEGDGAVDAAELGGPPVTLHVHEVPVDAVLAPLGEALRLPIHHPPQAEPDRITLDADGVPAGQVLSRVLAQTDFGFEIRTGLLVSPRPVDGG